MVPIRKSSNYCCGAVLSLWTFPRTPLGGWAIIRTQNDFPMPPPNSHSAPEQEERMKVHKSRPGHRGGGGEDNAFRETSGAVIPQSTLPLWILEVGGWDMGVT